MIRVLPEGAFTLAAFPESFGDLALGGQPIYVFVANFRHGTTTSAVLLRLLDSAQHCVLEFDQNSRFLSTLCVGHGYADSTVENYIVEIRVYCPLPRDYAYRWEPRERFLVPIARDVHPAFDLRCLPRFPTPLASYNSEFVDVVLPTPTSGDRTYRFRLADRYATVIQGLPPPFNSISPSEIERVFQRQGRPSVVLVEFLGLIDVKLESGLSNPVLCRCIGRPISYGGFMLPGDFVPSSYPLSRGDPDSWVHLELAYLDEIAAHGAIEFDDSYGSYARDNVASLFGLISIRRTTRRKFLVRAVSEYSCLYSCLYGPTANQPAPTRIPFPLFSPSCSLSYRVSDKYEGPYCALPRGTFDVTFLSEGRISSRRPRAIRRVRRYENALAFSHHDWLRIREFNHYPNLEYYKSARFMKFDRPYTCDFPQLRDALLDYMDSRLCVLPFAPFFVHELLKRTSAASYGSFGVFEALLFLAKQFRSTLECPLPGITISPQNGEYNRTYFQWYRSNEDPKSYFRWDPNFDLSTVDRLFPRGLEIDQSVAADVPRITAGFSRSLCERHSWAAHHPGDFPAVNPVFLSHICAHFECRLNWEEFAPDLHHRSLSYTPESSSLDSQRSDEFAPSTDTLSSELSESPRDRARRELSESPREHTRRRPDLHRRSGRDFSSDSNLSFSSSSLSSHGTPVDQPPGSSAVSLQHMEFTVYDDSD